MGHSETDIEAALLKIYRTLLGVEAKTATDGLRHELGIASQKVRADGSIAAGLRRMRTSRLALPFSDVPFSAGWVS